MTFEKLNCVLLIDHDRVSNFLNERIITRTGITSEIKQVQNGQYALEFINEFVDRNKIFPQLIFLDLNMPVMDGEELLDRLALFDKVISKDSLIFILTASTHPDDIRKISRFPHVSLLPKPLTHEKLLNIYALIKKIKKYYRIIPR
ncbi:MAG: response regulator [Cytophagaceae bacterium]|nr:response regulator [Cytophagaceae bacterium]